MTANEAGTASDQDAPDHVFKLSYLPILKQVQVFTIADALVPANLERTLSLMDMQIHLVTGGAGFLGSHLIDRLMESGDEVICLDNYFTGRRETSRVGLVIPVSNSFVAASLNRSSWRWTEFGMACPASPIHYQFNPVKTAKIVFSGPTTCWGWRGGWVRGCF